MLDFSELTLNTIDPVYVQINEFVKRQIFLGKAQKGDPLPSRRELAALLKINPNTAQKAYRAMEEAGVVLTPKNTVSILYFDEEMQRGIRREMTRDLVGHFVEQAKENRLELENVVTLVREMWKEGRDI